MELTAFESRISLELSLNEKDSRRMDRVIADLSENIGMSKQEILDFLIYGSTKELEALHISYDWEAFRRKIQSRLKK
ncbi:MAG TPA: hypothetical protein PK079_11735 [Leptospiraceae bacterium]|nr:hypothetical protein [Leptospiraceae bacterium]HMW07584.1 hypothetical protein [Leptospiraceae bacterium]HMX33038.1 hypothetical protein [Leptospiraceae bacterium]HMY33201.1 hypothetical protein [Leptospiraceae bacterium]HMZ65071.1 hypothetical protein [Leptospiraceae bacterium]